MGLNERQYFSKGELCESASPTFKSQDCNLLPTYHIRGKEKALLAHINTIIMQY